MMDKGVSSKNAFIEIFMKLMQQIICFVVKTLLSQYSSYIDMIVLWNLQPFGRFFFLEKNPKCLG